MKCVKIVGNAGGSERRAFYRALLVLHRGRSPSFSIAITEASHPETYRHNRNGSTANHGKTRFGRHQERHEKEDGSEDRPLAQLSEGSRIGFPKASRADPRVVHRSPW